MKARDAIKIIEKDGWFLVRQKEAISSTNILLRKGWLLLRYTNKVTR